MYKEASRLKLRFQTVKGFCSSEQLWDLTLTQLDELAVELEEEYKNSKGKSFLSKKTTKDSHIKLRFDIVLDVLNTLVKEQDYLSESQEIKREKQELVELLADKMKEEKKQLSVSELEKRIKELDKKSK